MYKFVIKILTPLVKFFLRVKVEGKVNVPEGSKFIICANHISNWDPVLVVVCTGIPINFLAKESLFKVPVVKNLVKAFGTIPINRNAPDTTSIRKSIEVIKSGGCFSIFPQGQRLHVKPSVEQAKNGVGLICNKAEAGVLPIGIYTKKYRIMPFRKIKVKIGDFIDFSSLDFGEGKPDYAKASRQIFEEICKLSSEEEK
jgi:1-acyl-sn-glycerol-3-phosphate acyltransferase